jgi:hypothetical protein
VVKVRVFGRYSRLSCVGSNLDQILITKKPTGESGAKVTLSCNCGRRMPKKVFRGQDGRVVKARVFWRYSQLSCVGSNLNQILITKKSTGWAVGVKILSRRYCGRRNPNCFEVLTIKLRVIEPRPNPDHKKVHRLGGWC